MMMRTRRNVAAASYVASARTVKAPSEHTSRIYRRLLIETAIACSYPLRLEHRSGAGRSTIRIVLPVGLQVGGPAGGGLLTARLLRQNHRLLFPIDEVDVISLAIEHLPADLTAAAGLSVGDAVRHDEFGLGVVQRFERSAGRTEAHVLFAVHGEQCIDNPAAGLTALDTGALAAGHRRSIGRARREPAGR